MWYIYATVFLGIMLILERHKMKHIEVIDYDN